MDLERGRSKREIKTEKGEREWIYKSRTLEGHGVGEIECCQGWKGRLWCMDGGRRKDSNQYLSLV